MRHWFQGNDALARTMRSRCAVTLPPGSPGWRNHHPGDAPGSVHDRRTIEINPGNG
jgi:hypothetical protein